MISPVWTNGLTALYQADAREIPLPDRSVHCVVTSPPYWGLRDYGIDATGIGLEPTLSEWLANIVAVSREVWRVLRDDGTYWLNLGDSYSTGASGDQSHKAGAGSVNPNQGSRRTKPAMELPAKNLMGQPWRVAFALQDDGWILRSAIVWHKPNPMPESVSDRPTSAYEMAFLFAKCGGTSQFWTHRDGPGTRTSPESDYRWQDALTGVEYTDEPPNYSEDMMPCPDCDGVGEITQQFGQVSMFDGIPEMVHDCGKCDGDGEIKRWKRVNIWTGHDYFYDADAVRQPYAASVVNDKRGNSNGHRRNRGFPGAPTNGGTNLGGNANGGVSVRNVWQIPTQGRRDAHFATFPDELPRRCILAGTSAHGVCAECGAPWARVVERKIAHTQKVHNVHGNAVEPNNAGSNRARDGHVAGIPKTQTVGWQPTCDHNADRVPATVLDPFVGSGTTCAVAQRLGRRSAGIDLSKDYLLNIARPRLEGIALPMELGV